MLDVAPPQTPSEATGPSHVAGPLEWTAAGLLLAAAVVGLVSIFPDYYSGQGSLDTRADELVPVLVVVVGWLACGALVASRRPGAVVAGAWVAAGIAVAEIGLRVADTGQLTSGVSAGKGLWLLDVAWAAGAAGAALAVVAAHRAGLGGGPALRPARGATGTERAFGVLAVVAGVLAAVAFIPSWDRYLATSAVDPTFFATVTAGNAFHNPGLVIAGNVVAAVAFALLAAAAALWRPARTGGALLAGAVVVLTAQITSAAAQVLERPDPLQLFTPAQVQALQPTVTLHLTGWFDAEMVALMLLLIVAASRLHHPLVAQPLEQPAGADPEGLGPWVPTPWVPGAFAHGGTGGGGLAAPPAPPGVPAGPPPEAPRPEAPAALGHDGPGHGGYGGPGHGAPEAPGPAAPDADQPATGASWGDIPAPTWDDDRSEG